MMHSFPDLVVGDVLVAPFVSYAVVAALIMLLLRPVLNWIGFERAFSNPPLVLVCLYTFILTALIVVF